ncbi:MAG: M1 family metallopeptidase [Rhodothermales bacterium]|nr:M1 family metallopeptidase [Rhodothermales bacterium]
MTAPIRRRSIGFASAALLFFLLAGPVLGQNWRNVDGDVRSGNHSMFRPIDSWPDPTTVRGASGAPGVEYWQQRADYVIETRLDTVSHSVSGSETITYHNNSPDVLTFVWVQLDQNVRSIENSRSYQMAGALPENISPRFRQFLNVESFDGGYDLTRVQVMDGNGHMIDADHVVRNTIMRIDLPEPLVPGGKVSLGIDWSYRIPDDGRGAKELVSDGWLYEIAQWFPRMSVYDDVNGWQTEQFLGRGEFYLNFGSYDVKITVPWNHIVEATGELQNPEDVLTREQIRRLKRAYTSEEPAFIISPDEVLTRSSRPVTSGDLTWHFKAEDVRDFAWVSSKTYVWDAAGFSYDDESETIKVHSFYPKDAMPLWDKVSTRATVVTLESYGDMSMRYPYPKASNVHGPVFGMEYPMIAFCGARPAPDGTYSDALERALIGVTIHEVGHNWVPMIIASDERKWTWMDEGMNTFLQYYAEQRYARKFNGTDVWTQTDDGTYPSRRGPATNIVEYMKTDEQVPIMTESDLIQANFGNNGYAKPATGLVMLREQVLGPDVFDDAFREYSRRWAFKHPQPADFFRSLEETAGENLNWFWRGWFYTTYANDQKLSSVTDQSADSLIGSTRYGGHYYRIKVENEGQLIMPVQLRVTYEDGTSDFMALPADVWRANELEFTKGFFSDRKVTMVELDPNSVFADIDPDDNVWRAPDIEAEPAESVRVPTGDYR